MTRKSERLVSRTARMRVRLPPPASHPRGSGANGRRAVLKKRSLRVRAPPPASFARACGPTRQRRRAQNPQVESSNLSTRIFFKLLAGRLASRSKPLDLQSRDAWVRIPHAPPIFFTTKLSHVDRSSMVERRAVDAVAEGSSPFDPLSRAARWARRSKPPESQSGSRRARIRHAPPNFFGSRGPAGSGRLIVNQEIAGSSPAGSA